MMSSPVCVINQINGKWRYLWLAVDQVSCVCRMEYGIGLMMSNRIFPV